MRATPFAARRRRFLGALLGMFLLTACDPQVDTRAPGGPRPIEAGDECHVCGMILARFPGPMGEVIADGQPRALKFCSTRDLFAYLLQPEAGAVVREVYVHDMAGARWDHPLDAPLVDARRAWYVAGHPLRGAMGPTLASFREREDAEVFARRFGGRILAFDQITLELVGHLGYGEGQAGEGGTDRPALPASRSGLE